MNLTTVEAVKQYLGITNVTDDPLFERLVEAASQYVLTYTNRSFEIDAYVDTFDGLGMNTYVFKNYPVTGVSYVSSGNQEISAAPDAYSAGYRFSDTKLVLQGYGFQKGFLNCQVAYTAGFDAVPADVQQATIEIVAFRYKEKDRIGLTSKGLAGESIGFSQKDMPSSASTILAKYKKVVPN